MDHWMFVFCVFLALLCAHAESAAAIMRKEEKAAEIEGTPDTAEVHKKVFEILSGGAIALQSAEKEDAATTAKLAAHLTSFAQMRQNFIDVDRMITELEQEDVVHDGFVEPRVTLDERLKWLKGAKKREAKKIAEGNKGPTPEEAASSLEQDHKAQKYGHYETVHHIDSMERGGVFGFWAKDRPHELRLDPANMKVYSYGTFKLRYPHLSSWNTETMFKKLPKAPHRVSRNKVEGAASLLDAEGEELVYIQDHMGFWYQGRDPPSKLEMLKKHNPVDWKDLIPKTKTEAQLLEQERFMLFPNSTDLIREQVANWRNAKSKVERENVRERLLQMRYGMAKKLKLTEKKGKGRANVNVLNYAGSMCGFEVEIGKVTAMALKLAIEKKFPKMKPKNMALFYGTTELWDDELLGEHMAAGEQTIDVLQGMTHHHIGTTRTIAPEKSASLVEKKPTVKSPLESSAKPAKLVVKPTVTSLVEQPAVADKLAVKPAAKEVSQNQAHSATQEKKAAKVEGATTMPATVSDSLVQTGDKKATHKAPKTAVPRAIRRTLYVREEDGTIHVEKQEVSTVLHPLEAQHGRGQEKFGVIDRGIPISFLLEEEDKQNLKESELVKPAHPEKRM